MGAAQSDDKAIDLARVTAETPDGVLCVSAGGEILYANRAAERMLRYPPKALVGRFVEDLLEAGAWVLDAVAPDYSGASAVPALARCGDGASCAVELSVASHAGPGEAPRFISVVVRPALRDRAQVAAELALERDAFLAMAAHQLRSPIQPILASLRTIERAQTARVRLPPDTLPRALRQTVRLGRLVDAILRDVTTPEGHPVPVDVERFDLNAMIGTIVDDYRLAAPARAFRFQSASGPVLIVSDPDRVDQILGTLIDNALKYSPRDRPIAVEIAASPSGPVVRVIDEGIGVPTAERDQIFAKFFRGSNVRFGTQGLGMGLYVARSLAARLAGNLSVESLEGHGSMFVLALPWALPAVRDPDRGREAVGGAHGEARSR